MSRAKPKKSSTEVSVSDKPFKNVFLPVLSFIVLAHLLSAYWGIPYLWGIHHLHFFPGYVAWILTAATLSLFITPVNRFLLKFLESILEPLGKLLGGARRYPVFVAAGLLSIPVFWLLRTRLFLLGDGYFILGTLPDGLITPAEPLDRAIHHLFYRLLTGVSPGADVSLAYTILSVLCGGAFVFLILALSDRLGKTGFQKTLIFCSLLSLGSIQLFFGYVESYTLLLLSLTLYIALSILHLQGKISAALPFLALILSIALHVLAVVFIPSFVWLVLRARHKGGSRSPGWFTFLSLGICLGIICYAVWRFFLVKFEGVGFSGLLPLLPSEKTSFTLFSGAHLAEFVNGLFLVSPVGITLYLFFGFYALKLRSPRSPVSNFLLISSLSALALVFVYDCHWGSADWDLMSFPGIFFTLCGALLFIRWGGRWPRFKSYALTLMAVGFFHTVPWVLVNADRHRSLDRYLITATNDIHLLGAEGGGMWRIARILESAGFPGKAEEVLKEGIRRNPRELGCYTHLGRMLYSQERYDEARLFLKQALELEPDSRWVQFSLGLVCLETGELEEAIHYLEQAREEHADDQAFIVTLSKAYLRVGRIQEAINALQDFAAKHGESATIRGLLGTSFYMLDDFSGAKEQWQRALKLDPNEQRAKLGLEQLRELQEE